jgi:hypothetical protein
MAVRQIVTDEVSVTHDSNNCVGIRANGELMILTPKQWFALVTIIHGMVSMVNFADEYEPQSY